MYFLKDTGKVLNRVICAEELDTLDLTDLIQLSIDVQLLINVLIDIKHRTDNSITDYRGKSK
jgi:hypothetical protein